MRWGDIDLDNRVLFVRGAKAKRVDCVPLLGDTAQRLADQEQQAYARSLLVQFETRVKQTESLIQQVEQRNAAYREQMDALLTNEEGKRLGRKGISVAMHFMGYQEQPLVEPSDLTAKKAFIEQMLAFLERAKSGPDGHIPQPERVEEADDAYLWARSRAMKLSETDARLKENLASLDRSEDASADPTLSAPAADSPS